MGYANIENNSSLAAPRKAPAVSFFVVLWGVYVDTVAPFYMVQS